MAAMDDAVRRHHEWVGSHLDATEIITKDIKVNATHSDEEVWQLIAKAKFHPLSTFVQGSNQHHSLREGNDSIETEVLLIQIIDEIFDAFSDTSVVDVKFC
jgi:hypothetical protein